MARRHPLPPPHIWLFSDERSQLPVVRLAAVLPPGSGIVVRHDDLPLGQRWRLVRRLLRIARARDLRIWLADAPARAWRWGADGVHLRHHHARRAGQAHGLGLAVSMPVHTRAEASRAARARALVAFISPLHPTRSHPGGATLTVAQWLRLARCAGGQPVALGGMTRKRALKLRRMAAGHRLTPGWAAIDAWDEMATKKTANRRKGQKRKAVPT